MSDNSESLSADDLRSRLYHSMREKGLVDALKSQLRNRMVTELKQIGVSQEFQPKPVHADDGSLLHRAANSLVADHLRRNHYDYSLSVFLPEAALAADKLFTTRDLLQLLNISPHCKLYKDMCDATVQSYNKKGFLWQLLCEISHQHGYASRDSGCQTDTFGLPPMSSLHEKFRQVDEYYSSVTDDSKAKGAHVEERILAYQRQLDERSRSEIQLEVSRFKDTELAKMRMEEREKCRKDLENSRNEMERTYKAKYDGLVERERHSIERLQKQQEIQEKETFSQRQSVLDEIDIVKQRDIELRRQIEIYQREKQLLEERVKTREENTRKREEAVKRAEVEYEQRVNEQMSKFKLDQEQRYMQRFKDLEWREVKVKEDERRVGDELMEISKTKNELRDKRIRCNELENEVEKTRRDLLSAQHQSEALGERVRGMVDYQVLKEENLMLKRDLEQIKERLAECNRDLMLERHKYEDALREMGEKMSRPTPDTLLLKRELDKARTSLQQEHILAEHNKQRTQISLQEEIERNRDLMRRYEEQTLQQKEMNRELNDLRRQLGNTRTALNNEVYRNPKGSLLRSQSPSLCDLEDNADLSDLGQQRPSPGIGSANDSELIISRDDDDPVGVASQSEDYSYCSDLVLDTKKRLKSLEKEAENLEQNYRNFQFRMTSVGGAITDVVNRSRVGDISRNSLVPTAPVGLTTPVRVSTAALSTSRPLSSTPYRAAEVPGEYTPPSQSAMSRLHVEDDRPRMNLSVSSVNSSPDKSEGRKTGTIGNRPMKLTDLEARPGEPSVILLEGSGGSQHNGNINQHNNDPGPLHVSTSMAAPEHKDHYRISPPGQERSERSEVKLDTAWKSNKESESEKKKREKEEQERREEEDRAYEEERRKREEERRRKEEEAWEREQKELEKLERGDSSISSKASEAPDEKADTPDEKPGEPAIDPVMQKYMEMVQQQKQREKEVAKNAVNLWNKGRKEKTPSQSEQEISRADEKSEASGGGFGSDDGFADW